MAKFIPLTDKDTKELRSKLGLPTTKDLIYMKSTGFLTYEPKRVIDYEIQEEFDITSFWAVLKVFLEDGSFVMIHSDHFANMQKPSFVNDMKKGMTA